MPERKARSDLPGLASINEGPSTRRSPGVLLGTSSLSWAESCATEARNGSLCDEEMELFPPANDREFWTLDACAASHLSAISAI